MGEDMWPSCKLGTSVPNFNTGWHTFYTLQFHDTGFVWKSFDKDLASFVRLFWMQNKWKLVVPCGKMYLVVKLHLFSVHKIHNSTQNACDYLADRSDMTFISHGMTRLEYSISYKLLYQQVWIYPGSWAHSNSFTTGKKHRRVMVLV